MTWEEYLFDLEKRLVASIKEAKLCDVGCDIAKMEANQRKFSQHLREKYPDSPFRKEAEVKQ